MAGINIAPYQKEILDKVFSGHGSLTKRIMTAINLVALLTVASIPFNNNVNKTFEIGGGYRHYLKPD